MKKPAISPNDNPSSKGIPPPLREVSPAIFKISDFLIFVYLNAILRRIHKAVILPDVTDISSDAIYPPPNVF